MQIITDHVFPDEPCMQLQEGPYTMPHPSGKGTWKRWVQRVFVIRNDAIAKHLIDLGPLEDFEHSTPVILPSLGENTVAQLQEHAERSRYDDRYEKYRQELKAESTLIPDILRQEEAKLLAKQNRSVIGPYQRTQRGAWPREYVERTLKEALHG
ncbi:MAG TPA: hypothetical protein DCP69_07400 [Candidatus Omnitrophica bacterium]|nr:hypothetical protein [Candidatus Omnitrophota bacterium]